MGTNACIIPISWCCIKRIQRKPRFAGNTEILQGDSNKSLICLLLILRRSETQFIKAIRDEEDSIDEGSICRTFDFKVAEKTVCSEEIETFFDNVLS